MKTIPATRKSPGLLRHPYPHPFFSRFLSVFLFPFTSRFVLSFSSSIHRNNFFSRSFFGHPAVKVAGTRRAPKLEDELPMDMKSAMDKTPPVSRKKSGRTALFDRQDWKALMRCLQIQVFLCIFSLNSGTLLLFFALLLELFLWLGFLVSEGPPRGWPGWRGERADQKTRDKNVWAREFASSASLAAAVEIETSFLKAMRAGKYIALVREWDGHCIRFHGLSRWGRIQEIFSLIRFILQFRIKRRFVDTQLRRKKYDIIYDFRERVVSFNQKREFNLEYFLYSLKFCSGRLHFFVLLSITQL